MKRRTHKCQRCGRVVVELVVVDTPAGKRALCVLCRTPALPFPLTTQQIRRVCSGKPLHTRWSKGGQPAES